MFAALTDRAQSRNNTAQTGVADSVAAISVAPWGPHECGAFTDDLLFGLFSVQFEKFDQEISRSFCIRNVGSHPVNLFSKKTAVLNVDMGCAPGEAEFDANCRATETGELGEVALLSYSTLPCAGGTGEPFGGQHPIFESQNLPVAMGSLASGETRCFTATVSISRSAWTDVPTLMRIQTDQIGFHLEWVAEA